MFSNSYQEVFFKCLAHLTSKNEYYYPCSLSLTSVKGKRIKESNETHHSRMCQQLKYYFFEDATSAIKRVQSYLNKKKKEILGE